MDCGHDCIVFLDDSILVLLEFWRVRSLPHSLSTEPCGCRYCLRCACCVIARKLLITSPNFVRLWKSGRGRASRGQVWWPLMEKLHLGMFPMSHTCLHYFPCLCLSTNQSARGIRQPWPIWTTPPGSPAGSRQPPGGPPFAKSKFPPAPPAGHHPLWWPHFTDQTWSVKPIPPASCWLPQQWPRTNAAAPSAFTVGRLNPSQVVVLNHNRYEPHVLSCSILRPAHRIVEHVSCDWHEPQGVTIAPASSTSTCTAPPGSPPVTHHSDWPSRPP